MLKLFKIIIIAFFALVIGLSVAMMVYNYATAEKDLNILIQDMDRMMDQLITDLEGANLDDSAECEKILMQISDALFLDIEESIEVIRDYTFQDFSDEVEKQMHVLTRKSGDMSFSFSFDALNACRDNSFFTLDEDKLKLSLREVQEEINTLKELCNQGC